MWLEGLALALSGPNLAYLAAGTVVGLMVGILPALGPAFGVALMLPFTFGMNPVSALIFLAAIHAVCAYSDSVTSILFKIPGSSITVPSCFDGFPMTQQGKGGTALGIAAVGSFVGGMIGWVALVLIAGPITRIAFEVGAPEYFAIGVTGLTLISLAAKGETLKGLLWACLGLTLSFIGRDPVTGLTARFTYGLVYLDGGLSIVAAMLGLFAVSQVMEMLQEGRTTIGRGTRLPDSLFGGFREVLRRPWTIARSGGLGLLIGILPAVGATMATLSAYLFEQKYSKEAPQFGRGAPGGLVAAEVGKGSCIVGDLIPTFTLGIPGSPTAALLMAALVIHGIDPGPRFLIAGKLPYAVFSGILLTQLVILLIGVSVIRFLIPLAYLPNMLLAPIIVVLSFLGAFVEDRSVFDVAVMVGFGLFGWFSERAGYPVVCVLLGMLLGPIIEVNFHRSLGIGFGSYGIFLTRPLVPVLLLLTLLAMVGPYVWPLIRRPKTRDNLASREETIQDTDPGVQRVEVALLALASLLFGVTLWYSRNYGSSTRLFPSIVAVAGLVLLARRVMLLITSRRPSRGRSESRSPSGISPIVAAVSLVGYVLLFRFLGLVLASAFFVAGMAGLARYPLRTAVLVSAGTAVFLVLFSRIFRL